MKASIVITTMGTREITRRAVRGALQQRLPDGAFEVVLVLDGAAEPGWCAAEREQARGELVVVRQPKSGQGACINAGIRRARGHYLLFLDDDILCADDLLQRHVAVLEKHPGQLGFGAIRTAAESRDSLATEWMRSAKDGWFDDRAGTDPGIGCFFSFANANTSAERSALLAAGLVDEDFPRYKDTEYGLRLWKQGLRFVHVPGAEVDHVVDDSLQAMCVRRAGAEGRAEVQLCRKHAEYRRYTQLGGLSEGRNTRRLARRLMVAGGPLSEAVLAPLLALANGLRRFSMARRVGMHLVGLRYVLHFYRAAIKECGGWSRFCAEFGLRLPVLCYHRVGRQVAGEWHALTISPERLEAHLRWLRRAGWTAVTTEQWADWLERGTPLPQKPYVLTLDDGYLENLDTAFPLFEKYGVPATTAAVSGRLGGESDWNPQPQRPRLALMNAEQVREWTARGMEFVSHTQNHPDLTRVDEPTVRAELAQSRAALEAVTGRNVPTLVYPFGAFNGAVAAAAAEVYTLAFGLQSGVNTIGTPRHALHRVLVSGRDGRFRLWFHMRFGRPFPG